MLRIIPVADLQRNTEIIPLAEALQHNTGNSYRDTDSVGRNCEPTSSQGRYFAIYIRIN
jgi:hypothetical protein